MTSVAENYTKFFEAGSSIPYVKPQLFSVGSLG